MGSCMARFLNSAETRFDRAIPICGPLAFLDNCAAYNENREFVFSELCGQV